jgi:hypothetical protein
LHGRWLGSSNGQAHEKDHPEKPHPRSRLIPLVRANFKDDLFINDEQRGFGKLLYAIMYMQDTSLTPGLVILLRSRCARDVRTPTAQISELEMDYLPESLPVDFPQLKRNVH